MDRGALVISTKIDLNTDVKSDLNKVCVLHKGKKVDAKDEFFKRIHCLFADILLSLLSHDSKLDDLQEKYTVLIDLNNKITVKVARTRSRI